jgi:hypothetical protein
MQIAGNTLAEKAVKEVKYYSQIPGKDPYDLNVARMDSPGGWIATPTDLLRFFVNIDGFRSTQLLSRDTLKIMTTPSQASPGYAKGLLVNKFDNWWHTGSLPGTVTIAVRTHTDFCWAAFTNTRSKFEDMVDALDLLGGIWLAASTRGAPDKRLTLSLPRSRVATRDVRFTSTPAVSYAQKAAIRRPLAERIRSTQSAMVNLNSAFRFAVVEC